MAFHTALLPVQLSYIMYFAGVPLEPVRKRLVVQKDPGVAISPIEVFLNLFHAMNSRV